MFVYLIKVLSSLEMHFESVNEYASMWHVAIFMLEVVVISNSMRTYVLGKSYQKKRILDSNSASSLTDGNF